MTTRQPNRSVSRRTALTAVGAGGLSLALAAARPVAAQDTADLASHPLVGTWAVMTPGGIVPQIHGSDGSLIAAFPANYVDPMLGLTFQGSALGQWASDGERSGHLTFLQALSDADGVYIGTFQGGGTIELSEDGQTWSSVGPSLVIVRDVTNTVIFDEMTPADPPVTATRIGATFESVVLPVVSPAAGTPIA